ncbi:MAG: OmpW family outer membrane protein [Pseudomonadota bacterium]
MQKTARNGMRAIAAGVMLALGSTAVAYEPGTWFIRGGVANVSPDASSSALVLDGTAIGASSADVEDNTQLGLTFGYMLTDHWAIEVLASTPFTHEITADTGALGLGTIDAGETTHLPPTVSLQYWFADSSSTFQPYVGAGLNYTLFFDEDVDAQLEGVLGPGDLSLDASLGLALQAGFDYALTDKLALNVGVWWVDIDTDAKFNFAANQLTTEVEIDPLVYSVSLGWRF